MVGRIINSIIQTFPMILTTRKIARVRSTYRHCNPCNSRFERYEKHVHTIQRISTTWHCPIRYSYKAPSAPPVTWTPPIIDQRSDRISRWLHWRCGRQLVCSYPPPACRLDIRKRRRVCCWDPDRTRDLLFFLPTRQVKQRSPSVHVACGDH